MFKRFVGFVRMRGDARPNWLHFALVGVPIAALAVAGLVCVPWPGAVTAPAVIRYSPEEVVRTECDGFVRDIRVHGGDLVSAGQVLAIMYNDELDHKISQLAVSVKESELKCRIYQRQDELAKFQAESEQLRTLEKQYTEQQREKDKLVVRAPCDGKVIGRNLESFSGRYLTKGSRLLSIGDERAKEIRLSIAQQDIHSFRAYAGRRTRVYLPDQDALVTTLTKVEPRASVVPLDMSLCALNGGALAVRAASDREGKAGGSGYELLSPRFTGTVQLDAQQSRQVHAGQRARVALRPYESIGSHLYHLASDWVDKKLRRRSHRRLSRARHY